MSFELLHGHNVVNIGVFIPEGIALAFALYFGKRVLPGIFVGQLVLALLNIAPFPALLIAIINTVEALIAIKLFERFHLHKDLHSLRDVIGLALLIVFILQPFSALLSNTALVVTDTIEMQRFWYSTFSWWFGNIMGQLLYTPFLLLLFAKYRQIDFKEYLLYGLATAIATYIFEIVISIENVLLFLSITVPFTILIVAKRGMVYGTFTTVVGAFVSAYTVYLEVGTFSLASVTHNTINYNLFILIHILMVFTAGFLFEERKAYEKALAQRVTEETRKNREQQLLMLHQSRFAQMGELIAMIAHQWRQPLNNLSLLNQLLVLKYEQKRLKEENVAQFKNESKKLIEFMSTTIDDFRNFFKPEAQKSEFVLNETVENIFQMIEEIYRREKITLYFSAQKEYRLTGYKNALSQAILNILNNARDALIEKEASDRKIWIEITAEEEEIVLTIQDNGGGIPHEIISRIFDPYFSTKAEKNGTGLGLYMSRIIIEEQLRGSIDVTNSEKGARFTITLSIQPV